MFIKFYNVYGIQDSKQISTNMSSMSVEIYLESLEQDLNNQKSEDKS